MDKKLNFDNEMKVFNNFQLKNINKKYKIGITSKIEPKIWNIKINLLFKNFRFFIFQANISSRTKIIIDKDKQKAESKTMNKNTNNKGKDSCSSCI